MLSIYLNGELVAKGDVFPENLSFPLNPDSFKLLKNGKNALAVSARRGFGAQPFGFRLEGILKNPSKQEKNPPKQTPKEDPKKKKGKRKR